jgi:hypothetical protein
MERRRGCAKRLLGVVVTTSLMMLGWPAVANAAPPVTVDITGPATIAENGGSATFKIQARSRPCGSCSVTVSWATSNGSATAGTDYTASGSPPTLTLNKTTWVRTVTVPILNDTVYETAETFSTAITAVAGGGTIGTGTVTTTINDNDPAPSVSINSVAIAEGDAGTATATFTVTRTGTTAVNGTVNFATSNGSATAGPDYAATSGTLTFTPAQTSRTVSVIANGDTVDENDETYSVSLSGATNLQIGTGAGTGTILDDDTAAFLSVGDVSAAEGDAGTSTATFTVTLAPASGKTVTVNYATADGSATAPSDYASASGTVTFTPGQAVKTIPVTVKGDTTREPDEGYTMNLSGATNASISDALGAGAIVNDDPVPTISIPDLSQSEGNAGTSTMTLAVTLDRASSSTITVDYATTSGTATAGVDYVAASGTLTFTPGQTSKNVVVTVNGDGSYENDETFTVGLSNASSASIADPSGLGTIANDDAAPSFSVNDLSFVEGNAGTSTITFTITKTGATAMPASVDFATADVTATASSDYVAASGSTTFAPGGTTKTVSVTIDGDVTYESGESFVLNLTNPINATIADAQGTASITNDDPLPSISIDDKTGNEGNAGSSNTTFSVSLSNPSAFPLTLDFATSNATATAGSDYAATTGTVTFAPGDVAKSVGVSVSGDTTYELNETFHVDLSNAVGGSITHARGVGTIVNDDPLPSVSIDDQTGNEGDVGSAPQTFTAGLSNPSAFPVTVDFATADGTAIAATGDYAGASGTVTFPAGTITRPIAVTVNGDTAFELDETFYVGLSNAVGGSITDAQGVGTIVNDDPRPTATIDDATIGEGNSGTTPMIFTVVLSNPIASGATVDYATSDGTATAGADYTPTSGTLTFGPAQTVRTITVNVIGDTMAEANETLRVILTNPSGMTLGKGQGTGRIMDDEATPAAEISDASIPEGNGGTSTATFTVTLSHASASMVTFDYATSDGTASAPGDYDAATGTVSFPPGQITRTIDVTVEGDGVYETDEGFAVTLSAPVNAVIADGSGSGTITNDDAPPALTIGDAAVTEGNAGTTGATFTVSLAGATDVVTSVDYATTDGTAHAGSDFSATAGALTFPVGVTTRPVTVQVGGDTTFEGDETFGVTLSNASNASISGAIGNGTIANDDKAPTTLTLTVKKTARKLIAKGMLTNAVKGQRVSITLSKKTRRHYRKVAAKTVMVKKILDRNGDSILEGVFSSRLPRPHGHGTYRVKVVFRGDATHVSCGRSKNVHL